MNVDTCDQWDFTLTDRETLCLSFLTAAPSAAPSRLSVRPSGQSYYASWEGLSKEQRNGQLEYQVLLYQCTNESNNTHLSDTDCGRCVQQAAHATLTTSHTSISLREATHMDTAYAVQVRGVTGQGSLKGPLSPPSCFTTPEGGECHGSHCSCVSVALSCWTSAPAGSPWAPVTCLLQVPWPAASP